MLLQEQILTFERRPHDKELHHPMKQFMQVNIRLFSEKKKKKKKRFKAFIGATAL